MPVLTAQSYRSTLAALVFAISAAAALGVVAWGGTPYAGMGRVAVSPWEADAVFLLDWLLMCTAMMLPTSMPLLAAVQRTVSRRADSAWLLAVCVAGFLGVWLAAGVVVRVGEDAMMQAALESRWFFAHQQQVLAGLLAAGGAYLLTPAAHNCVTACRSPLGFIARNWTGHPDVKMQVARIGVQYGWSCFGCCWPLMLVMCLLGVSNPLWMLLLTLVMVLQKQSRYGHRLTYGLGALLLIGAAGVVSGVVSFPELGASMCRV